MGGLGDLLKGPLGGILAGAAAGSAVNGGLSDLLNQFRKAGHGDAAGSWVGNGPNRPISPADLTKVLDGPDQYPDESIWVISRRIAGGSKRPLASTR